MPTHILFIFLLCLLHLIGNFFSIGTIMIIIIFIPYNLCQYLVHIYYIYSLVEEHSDIC